MTKDLSRKFLSLWGIGAVIVATLFFALPASAAALPPIVPACARNQGTEPPSLNCALQTFGNIAQLILGITGSFALLMFVYGGFTLMSSGGSSEKVSKGKTIITNAVIGIIIIFGSGLLINYGLSKIGVTLPTIGQTCCTAGKDGKCVSPQVADGSYIQVPGGTIECKKTCIDSATKGCFDPTTGKMR
jgi:hypothetical protein